MPHCQICSSHFPNTIKIDGKVRNLSSRRYCLECSPFGRHNTKVLVNNKGTNEIKCVSCGREYVYLREKGHSKSKCNTCWTNNKRREQKRMAVEYMGGSCIECGYSRCIGALEFHHQAEKDFNISQNNYIDWDLVKVELLKCVLACANCHREHHAGLLDLNRHAPGPIRVPK